MEFFVAHYREHPSLIGVLSSLIARCAVILAVKICMKERGEKELPIVA